MKRLYTIIAVLAVDEERAGVVEKARSPYRQSGAETWDIDDNGEQRLLTPEEAISSETGALIDLVYDHPDFDNDAIEVRDVTCACEEVAPDKTAALDKTQEEIATNAAGDVLSEMQAGNALDEYESGLYLCRWPNGEFSVVTALSRREAILEVR